MMSPTTKRRAVQMSVENGWGHTAQACRALGLARSSYYRPRQLNATQRQLQARIVQLSEQHPLRGSSGVRSSRLFIRALRPRRG